MQPALPLRLALMANAAFSLASALLMVFQPLRVGQWLGVHAPLILQWVGVGLALFAAALVYQATRQRVATWQALLASFSDLAWVMGSIVLLLLFPRLFSPGGNLLVLAVAGLVMIFGLWQLWAAGYAHKTAQKGVYRHCIVAETQIPAENMWRVVGDMGGIQRYMPSLKRSVILEGKLPGVGAVRCCEDQSGKQWFEACTAFTSGRSFDVSFLADRPDFPFPAKAMRGGWEVIPTQAGSQIRVWWELAPKHPLLAPILLPLLAFQVERDFPRIIQRMAAATISQDLVVVSRAAKGLVVRLLPVYC